MKKIGGASRFDLSKDAYCDYFHLEQNYPNPFNPSTIISWQLSTGNYVTLKVYDVLGREVITLVNRYYITGKYKVNFNANGLSGGVYFYKLITKDFI